MGTPSGWAARGLCPRERRGAARDAGARSSRGNQVGQPPDARARPASGSAGLRWRCAAVILAGMLGSALSAPVVHAKDPVARDVAVEAGLSYHGVLNGKSQGESPVFDYDGDGDLDILLSNHGGSPWPLMQNQGNGTFVEVLSGTFFKADRHGCVAADFGSIGTAGRPDGLPDVYCVTGACQGTCRIPYPNSLFIQQPDHTFVDVATSWGVADPHGRGRKAIAFDFDKDGLTDIVIANEGPSIFPWPNRMFRNVGGAFEEVTDTSVRAELDSICVTSGFIDADRWRDLLFCSKANPSVGVVTYRNDGGSFTDVTASTAYGKLRALDLKLSDVNGDGRQDLVILEAQRVSVWLNVNGKHPKANFSYKIGRGNDLAVGDVNRDRRPDIFVTQGPNNQFQHIMLINDGNGTSYHPIPLPVQTEGNGDVATVFPNWRDTGRAAFLVTNGKWNLKGPVQLFTFTDD